MNRVKKPTSVFTIVLFIAMLATPLLSAAECNMDCCSVPMTTDCGMDMDSDSCCPSISECSQVIFVPIITAPIFKVNIEKELTSEYICTTDILLKYHTIDSNPQYHLKILTTTIPPGFKIPLLV